MSSTVLASEEQAGYRSAGTGSAPMDLAGVVAAELATAAPVGPCEVVAAVEVLVDALAGEVLEGAGEDEALLASVGQLERVGRRMAAERVRRIGELDERQTCLDHGVADTAALVADDGDVSVGEARRDVETSTAMDGMPQTAARYAAGEIGPGQVTVVVRALRDLRSNPVLSRDPAAYRRSKGELDALCAAHGRESRRQLARLVADWQAERFPQSLADKERHAHAKRRFKLAEPAGPLGMRATLGELDPVNAALLASALEPLMRGSGAEDGRTLEQRGADALGELARRALDGSGLPEVAAKRPHVLVVTSFAALAGLEGAAPSELDGIGPVSSATAQRLACDGDVTALLAGRNGEILDVGRTRRRPTRRQRLAVIARDRRCIGCAGPAARCEVHHIEWWRLGGATDLDNLTLVCGSCHHRIHHRGWKVVRAGEGFRLERPPNGARGRAGDLSGRAPDPAARP